MTYLKQPGMCPATMPELPEIETLRRQLTDNILGMSISGLTFLDERIFPFSLASNVAVQEIRRWGKYLGICLTNGEQILVHLRMTGHLRLLDANMFLPEHSRFVISFGDKKVVCRDPRRFATFELTRDFFKLAVVPNPLNSFPISIIILAAAAVTAPIKQFILRQENIAGIGNIYACEILFDAGINPFKKTLSLTREEWKRMAVSSKKILKLGVKCRGSSISDWRDLFGEKGKYQERALVYGRGGGRCVRCGGTIQRVVIGGRGTFFCPMCQG